MLMMTCMRTGRKAAPAVLCTCLLLAGCQALPTRAPAAPELQLVAAGELALPDACQPSSGAVYRVSYVVAPDGRVTEAAADSGSACVQDALRQWVESFRYAPLPAALPATIDWMAVTAARGG